MDLDQRLHEAVLIQILESLTEQGFLRMLIWRGCGQHDLTEVVDTYNATYSGRGGISAGVPVSGDLESCRRQQYTRRVCR